MNGVKTMGIRKYLALLLVVVLTLTSVVNCFAVGSDSGFSEAGSESDTSLSDIELPDRVIYDVTDEDMEKRRQRVIQLLRNLNKSDEELVELKNIYERNKGELERLNKMLCETREKYNRCKIDLDAANRALRILKDDVLCKNCLCCRMSDEAVSLMRGTINVIPSNVIFRSKRFYIGVMVGAVVMTVVLVGAYVCVHFIKK